MSNKQSQRRKPAASPAADLPTQGAPTAEPPAAAPDARPPATKRRRTKPDAAAAASQRDNPPAEPLAAPAAKRRRAKPDAAAAASQRDSALAEPLAAPATKRRRAKPDAATPPAADVAPAKGVSPKPLASPAADTQPADKRRAKPDTIVAPVAASHSSGMPARPLAPFTAAPQPERVAASMLRIPASVAQRSQNKRAAADAASFFEAIPRRGPAQPSLAPAVIGPAPKTAARASLRERIPLSNDAISVFAVSAIFLIGLLLGFLMLEGNVQALEKRAPIATPIAESTSEQLAPRR